MSLSRSACVEFHDVVVIRDSDNAIFVEIEDQEVWIPKSQLHDDSEVYKADTEGTLIISEWIAKQKELV